MKLVAFQLADSGHSVLVNPEQVASVHEGVKPGTATISMTNGRTFDVTTSAGNAAAKLEGGG